MTSNRRVLGVAGGSAAGKGTLIRALLASELGRRVTVVECDRYFLGFAGVPRDAHGHGNFDHPSSLDVDLMVRNVRALAAGDDVDLPSYSFAEQSRAAEVVRVSPRDLIVVDGILSLHLAPLRPLYDTSVYVEAPLEQRYRRRLARDVRERGRPRDDVERQWHATVVPMHEKHVAPSRVHAAHVIDCRDGRREEASRAFVEVARALLG